MTLKKGALVALNAENGTLRVRVLSGPGHVSVVARGKTIPLGPGREAYLANHIPGDDEAHCRDDLGRRELRTYPLSGGCALTICDFSIISLLASKHHLKDLSRSESTELRRIFGRLVKTAAAVEQLTTVKGRYLAKPPVDWNSKNLNLRAASCSQSDRPALLEIQRDTTSGTYRLQATWCSARIL